MRRGKQERGRSKHQVSRCTPYPFNYAASDSSRRECAQCCCWGWFWVHMRAPDCLNPSPKSEMWLDIILFRTFY